MELANKEIKFSIKCDKCGSDARLIPTRFFQYQHNDTPTKITLEFACNCGNKSVCDIL